MAERKMIQVDKEVAGLVKEMYPDLSWTAILRLVLDSEVNQPPVKESPIKPIKDFATNKDLQDLKDKFNTALSDLIKQNNLKYIKK